MYMTCRHIKINGIQCGSPALKDAEFCYYHGKTHTLRDDVKFGPLQLPVPEDAAAIQLSVARICEAILTGRLDLRKASLLLTGLKLAARFINPKQPPVAGLPIQSVDHDSRGEEIAPCHFVCDEDEDDCDTCPHREQCPHPGHPGADDDEYEEDDEEEEDEDEDQDEDEDLGDEEEEEEDEEQDEDEYEEEDDEDEDQDDEEEDS